MSTPMDLLMDGAEWSEVDPAEIPKNPKLPYVTHKGFVNLDGMGRLEVLQLNTGQRIITEDSINEIFGDGFMRQFKSDHNK